MKTLISWILIAVFTLFSATGFAQNDRRTVKDVKILGRFIHLPKNDSKNKLGHEYYFVFQAENGSQMAYPAEFRDQNLANSVRQNLGKQYFIRAVPTEEKKLVGEQQLEVRIFNILDAAAIDLGALGSTDTVAPGQVTFGKKDRPEKPTFGGVNDTVTNTIIFSAGAALLGTMLLGK